MCQRPATGEHGSRAIRSAPRNWTPPKRILDAELSYPIILSADGRLMDGGHRLAKAWLAGATDIRAVRFVVDPAPDYIAPLRSS